MHFYVRKATRKTGIKLSVRIKINTLQKYVVCAVSTHRLTCYILTFFIQHSKRLEILGKLCMTITVFERLKKVGVSFVVMYLINDN